MTAVIERDPVAEQEVADLIAMLDGELECDLMDITETLEIPCWRAARWIGRLHCGHPVVMCDHHHRGLSIEKVGVLGCRCGYVSVWHPTLPIGSLVSHPLFPHPLAISGLEPNMWPL